MGLASDPGRIDARAGESGWYKAGGGIAAAAAVTVVDPSPSMGECCDCVGEALEWAGVTLSRLTDDVRADRRVMLLRISRIFSMSCTPSAGLGFLSLMYKSRCRPRDDEVNS